MTAANWVFQFSIISTIFSLLSNPYNAVIISREKMNVYAYISLFDAILKLIIVYMLLVVPFDRLIFWGFMLMILMILNNSIYFFYCNKKYQESRYSFYWDTPLFKQLLSYTGWNLFGSLSGVAKGQGLNILLNIFFNPSVNAARGIAYQMVRPQLVFEISVLELVARGNDDKIRMNPLLCYDEKLGWLLEDTTPGVSVLGITFNQERTDKQANTVDIRLSQLTDLCPFEEPEAGSGKLAESQLLERHVYKKVSGEKVMIHKFLLWKTNKEKSGRYPAYIIYHTDYSSARKEMIKRDMMYSSDEQQIRELLANEIAANVKKGWEEIILTTKAA